MSELTDTGRFHAFSESLRRIESQQNRMESQQLENSSRLGKLEDLIERLIKAEIEQREQSKAIERMFAQVDEMRKKMEDAAEMRSKLRGEFDVLYARGKTVWVVASLFWFAFGGVVTYAVKWGAAEVFVMRDTVAKHDHLISEFLRGRNPAP